MLTWWTKFSADLKIKNRKNHKNPLIPKTTEKSFKKSKMANMTLLRIWKEIKDRS